MPEPLELSHPAPGVATPGARPVFTRVRHALRARRATVTQVLQRTPHTVDVVLQSPDLQDLTSASPFDHVKVVFPDAPGAPVRLPVIESDRPTGSVGPRRDYSLLAFDAHAGEATIRFVLHPVPADAPADTYVAARWALRAARGEAVGEELGLLGPRGSKVLTPDLAWYVLAADETGTPAVARWLAEAPAGTRATVLLEATDRDEILDLPTAADADVRWLIRDGQPAGTTALLREAIGHVIAPGAAPRGEAAIVVLGEADALRGVRHYLRDECGFAPDHIEISGYWRRGVADRDHHEPVPD